jgi:gamma-glutamyltranspeptidase/glutathione hydrolase
MVVSGHGDATQVAWRTLDAGGSVADAAIAGAAVLAVTQPQASTLGGDAFILVHEAASKTTRGLNASGPSPRLATRERFEKGMPQRGAMSATVPAVVAGWEALHKRFGKLAWKDLLQPAIALASEGCAASRIFAKSTEVYADLIRKFEPTRNLFCPQDRPLKEGERFVQPALARTLEAIARDGARALYEGPIAKRIAQACEAQGGLLRAEDFPGTMPEWVSPIEVEYRGHRVRAMPPNSYGLYLLLQLMFLENEAIGREATGSSRRITSLVRAAKAAFAVADRAVADPNFGPEPFAPLLGEAGRQRLRAAGEAKAPNLGGTAVISVVDAAGNAVTIVQSIFLVFGSGTLDPESGVLLTNRMFGFNTQRGHPNEVAPRKRPAHTLCPCHVFDASGELRYALGTPGGPGQTLTISHVVQAVLDAGLSLEDAISVPRWSQDLASQAVVEDSMPQATLEGALKLGVPLAQAQPNSPFFGSAEGIARAKDGTLTGVADFRRDAATYGQ